jgi:hypothetical protein
MLEWVMLLATGFMAGCLLMIAFVPAIHNRAVRLTARHFQAKTPLSMFEMEAEKDLLRAEFAMALRRLEVIVEETKSRSVQQLSEIGRKTAEIHHLKTEIHRLKTELGKTAPPPSVPSRIRMALVRAGMTQARSDAA